LRQYWREYKPKTWLFEGFKEGRYISTRTVQAIFEQAKEKASITKDEVGCPRAVAQIPSKLFLDMS
jgi:hypothetical protein